MDLVVHEVAQLEHVDRADGHVALELLAAATVAQASLAGGREAGVPDQLVGGLADFRRRPLAAADHREVVESDVPEQVGIGRLEALGDRLACRQQSGLELAFCANEQGVLHRQFGGALRALARDQFGRSGGEELLDAPGQRGRGLRCALDPQRFNPGAVERGTFELGALEILNQRFDPCRIRRWRRRRQTHRLRRPVQAGEAQQYADLALLRTAEHRRLRLEAEDPAAPAEVRLEDLAHVHPARNAQRVEHDVDRRAVRKERHVLFRYDARHDALVAVPAGHLVAHRDLPLLGDVDLDQLDHSRREFIRLEDLVDLVFRLLLDLGALRRGRIERGAKPLIRRLVADPQRLEVDLAQVDLLERRPGELEALRPELFDRAGAQHQPDVLALEQLGDLFEHRLRDARLLLAFVTTHIADALTAILVDHGAFDP